MNICSSVCVCIWCECMWVWKCGWLHVWLCLCICCRSSQWVQTWVSVCEYMWGCVYYEHAWECTHVFVFVTMSICEHGWVCECMSVHMWGCVCVTVWMCVYAWGWMGVLTCKCECILWVFVCIYVLWEFMGKYACEGVFTWVLCVCKYINVRMCQNILWDYCICEFVFMC